MEVYILEFTANGNRIVCTIEVEVLTGQTTLTYKTAIDDKINEWLQSNGLNGLTTKVVDIVLLNNTGKILYTQHDWLYPNSINIKNT